MKWLLMTVSAIAFLTVDSRGFTSGHNPDNPSLGHDSPRQHYKLKKILPDGLNLVKQTGELKAAPVMVHYEPRDQELPEVAHQTKNGLMNMSNFQRSDLEDNKIQTKMAVKNSYCIDKNLQCQGWAARGECEKNPYYMLTSCPVSCYQCDSYCIDKNLQCQGWAARGECEKNPYYMLTSCPISCYQCDSYCLDKNRQCHGWAARGECEKNPAYMLTSCPVSCNLCESSLCGIVNRRTRIVNGITTEENEYPWQALVGQARSNSYCGGSLINDRWVLTAAHCTDEGVTQVILGNHVNSQTDSAEIIANVKRVVNHPNYSGETYTNDFALLELETPLDLEAVGPRIRPICLPSASNPSQYENVDAIVTGWGHTKSGGSNSDTLQEVTVKTMSNSVCSQRYPGKIYDSMICASNPGKDSCQNDSGGPIVKDVGSHFILIGVVSWGYGCAHPSYPGVYARVTDAIDWITITSSSIRISATPN